MSEFAAETTAALQEAAEETPLPAESRQSLDTLLERPLANGSGSDTGLEQVEERQNEADASDEQHGGAPPEEHEGEDRIAQLQAELERITNERDTFQSQYRGLLGKLSNMRTTLGDKLRQDAVSQTDTWYPFTRNVTLMTLISAYRKS